MLGFRFGRWVHAAIAGGSLTLTGCVDRVLLDDSLINVEPTGGQTTETDSDPTDPTNPTDPSDPTTDPTNPTDPTSE